MGKRGPKRLPLNHLMARGSKLVSGRLRELSGTPLHPVARKVSKTRTRIDHLRHGHGTDETDSALRRTWFKLKRRILAEHASEEPGSRPWAWWKWEAKEPRRRLDGLPHYCNEFYFGVPQFAFTAEDCDVEYESQADYLRRHKSMSKAEDKAALAMPVEDGSI